MRSILHLSVLPILVTASSGASSSSFAATPPKRCKAYPGTPEWPSDDAWTTLNTTVKGRLLKPVAPAAPCHEGNPAYNAETCSSLKTGWMFSGWHASHPTSMMWQNFNNYSCVLDTGASCTNEGYPVYVVEAHEASDVKAAVDFARTRNVRLNIKSTGHDYMGRSTQPNSLSIWTHNLKTIEWIDGPFTPKGCDIKIDGKGFLRVGSGNQWRDVNKAASEKNVTVVSGGFDTVSVGGYLANGGHGGLSAKYGLGADMVAEIELVNAAGDIITANECQNQDYFWAMRGGGGSTYGVVLTYTLQTLPDMVTSRYLGFLSGWDEVVHMHRKWPKIAELGGGGYFMGFPSANGTLGLGSTVLVEIIMPNFTFNELRAVVNPLFQGLGGFWNESFQIFPEKRDVAANAGKSVAEMRGNYTEYSSWHEAQANLSPDDYVRSQRAKLSPPPSLSDVSIWDIFPGIGTNKIISSWLYSAEDVQSPKLKEALQGAFPETDTTSLNLYLNDATMGVGTHKPPFMRGGGNAVNPAFRTAIMRPAAEFQWMGTDAREEVRMKKVAATCGESLRSINPSGGTYANEADPEQPNWQHAFWGDNYPRLLEIKKKVDPEGVFYCRACVGSEFMDDWDGVLCQR